VLAAVLGQASQAQLVIVGAIGKIERYHNSRATLTINGQRMTGECTQHWGARGHIETVTLSNGRTFVKIGDKLIQTGAIARDEFELVGCPRSLVGWLIDQLNRTGNIDMNPVRVDDRPAYSLRVPSAQIPLDLYLTRPGELPIELAISAPGIQATSRVELRASPTGAASPHTRLPSTRRRTPVGDCQKLRPLTR
jgi:hypothetical protein